MTNAAKPACELSRTPQALFGGAVRMRMPSGYTDVSGFRQVPDHQEVWVGDGRTAPMAVTAEGKAMDGSVIVELLETPAQDGPAVSPARVHWGLLVEANGCRSGETSLVLRGPDVVALESEGMRQR